MGLNDSCCRGRGGTPVRFRIERYTYKGSLSITAVDIRPVFRTDVPDPQLHREVSVVDHIVPGSHEPIGSVFLRRESGGKLYLSQADVADAHRDKCQTLKGRAHAWHGVAPPANQHPTCEQQWWCSTAKPRSWLSQSGSNRVASLSVDRVVPCAVGTPCSVRWALVSGSRQIGGRSRGRRR